MDTKWKKWKNRIGFILFAIGLSTLVVGLKTGLHLISRDSLTDKPFLLAFTNDYQDTDAFQDFISGKLNDYLAIANGTYVDWDYSRRIFDDEDSVEETVTSEAFSYAYEGDYDAEYAEYAEYAENFSAEQHDMMARNYLQSDFKNKNILFEISKAGKVLYTNMETPYHKGESLPAGYNYLMCFNGKKVEVTKDGQKLNIYDDGIYTNERSYQVPGYDNFTVDDSLQDVSITMIVIQIPLQYRITSGGNTTYYSNGNLYCYYRDLQQIKEDWENGSQLTLLGLFISFLSFIMIWKATEEKKKLATILNRIWLEAKIVLLLLIAQLSIFNLDAYFSDGYAYEYHYLAEDYGYGNQTVQFMVRDWFDALQSNTSLILLVFWFVLFLILDIVYNHSKKPHSLIYSILSKLDDRTLKMPFAKRQIRRLMLIIFAVVILFALLIAAIIVYDYSDAGTLLLTLAAAIILIASMLWYYRTQYAQARDLDILNDQISRISRGDYSFQEINFQGKDLTQTSQNLFQIQNGIKKAVDDQLRSERMKVDLVANVSHDLKTPLTSIISYINFLKEETDLPDHVKDYIKILDEKSKRLNEMVQDVFAISKASSGQLPVNLEILDFGKLLNQTLADMDETISGSDISVKSEISEHEYFIKADGQRMYRVCQNLIQNALKYSLEGSRMYISLEQLQGNAVATFKNISKTELSMNTDFSARFVRGDESRTDGGSGLGLSIAKSFTEACGGSFTIEINGDMFIVSIAFQLVPERQVLITQE